MSLDYVEITLDRTRKMRFGLRDLRDLERRLGGIPFQQVLENLRRLHLETLVHTLAVGLRFDDPKLDVDKVEGLLQAYLRGSGQIKTVMDALVEAFMLSGVVGRPEAPDEGGSSVPPPLP